MLVILKKKNNNKTFSTETFLSLDKDIRNQLETPDVFVFTLKIILSFSKVKIVFIYFLRVFFHEHLKVLAVIVSFTFFFVPDRYNFSL